MCRKMKPGEKTKYQNERTDTSTWIISRRCCSCIIITIETHLIQPITPAPKCVEGEGASAWRLQIVTSSLDYFWSLPSSIQFDHLFSVFFCIAARATHPNSLPLKFPKCGRLDDNSEERYSMQALPTSF